MTGGERVPVTDNELHTARAAETIAAVARDLDDVSIDPGITAERAAQLARRLDTLASEVGDASEDLRSIR